MSMQTFCIDFQGLHDKDQVRKQHRHCQVRRVVEWSMSKFPCSLTRNMTSHSMGNLTFHSLLRWKVIILQILATSLIQYNRFLKGWENTLFELRSERVNLYIFICLLMWSFHHGESTCIWNRCCTVHAYMHAYNPSEVQSHGFSSK